MDFILSELENKPSAAKDLFSCERPNCSQRTVFESVDCMKQSCEDFTEALASENPVPGGGGASALVGAVGVALCSMVGNLTVGRKKYAGVEADVYVMMEKAAKIRKRLLELAEEDAIAFEPLARAYKVPKNDPNRGDIMEAALTAACAAPLEMMRNCCDAIDLLAEMLEKGSVTLVSDVGVGALCCKAALAGAGMNVFINTKSMSDREKAKTFDGEAEEMLNNFCGLADSIAGEVNKRIRAEV